MGTEGQRPINSENPGALRFNSDTSLCEVYTESNIWSGLPVYKTEQPPPLLNITQNQSNETVTVNWEKFADIYKDVFDGKCYPIYLQTFVDISFTDINEQSSNGWKTIIIGAGNYDETGTSTTPLTSFVFNSVVNTNYDENNKIDDDGYSAIDFTNKPTTINLPVFTQDDSFDLRIYGVNKSGTLPNYNYIYNVQLKQTGPPGEVDVIAFESFGKNNFVVDLSFALDSSDASITSGISIVNYDVSFTLSGTKSLENRIHSGNQYTDWVDATSLSKSDLNVYDLFPGAQYDIQIRAQNALKLDPTSSTEYMYGEYGDVFTSSGFTNNSGNATGTSTTQYIDTGDLSGVTPVNMTFTLNNTKSIYGYTSNGTSLSNKTITNENGYIQFSGKNTFYVNYTKQGIDMSGVDNLVQATVELFVGGSVQSTDTITYDGTNNPSGVSVQTIDISNGGSQFYQFRSEGAYTDKSSGDDSTIGFVYSSTFDNSNNTTVASLNEIFVQNFPPSIDIYELKYTISGEYLDGYTDSYTKTTINESNNTTNGFYVDNYEIYSRLHGTRTYI